MNKALDCVTGVEQAGRDSLERSGEGKVLHTLPRSLLSSYFMFLHSSGACLQTVKTLPDFTSLPTATTTKKRRRAAVFAG